jgi:hypothetical protein
MVATAWVWSGHYFRGRGRGREGLWHTASGRLPQHVSWSRAKE